MQTEFNIQCPYCGESIWMELYPQEGARQSLIVDCEVCCRPIEYQIDFSDHEAPRLDVRRDDY